MPCASFLRSASTLRFAQIPASTSRTTTTPAITSVQRGWRIGHDQSISGRSGSTFSPGRTPATTAQISSAEASTRSTSVSAKSDEVSTA